MKWYPSIRRGSRTIRCSVSGSGSTPSSTNSTRSGTRLTRAIQAFQIKLIARIKELKRDFPVKILFFLVGFYCATAFATVIGQTGDWDILSAALAVTVVEAIGALMYGASLSELKKMRRSFFQSYRMRHLKSSIIEDYKYSVADPGEDSATDFSKYSGVPSLDLQYD
ncbi:hypothetical protein RJ639_004391 [Escallonia herrerae]|uniref:Ycf20 n=1 Tax=Escallonia herrerae TaxID=1293975 RepID=A0AA88WA46_9ASTE|nr:hypothetical protein RJ639_004391 [Escallonia herrerae]